jgi:RNA polymerase sigma factor (sigma-70 family)
MDERDGLLERFEDARGHLRGVAFRMLGSLDEADDAVQETWLRLRRSDTRDVDNLTGWLTTVTARVCLDVLRSRRSRREDAVGVRPPEPFDRSGAGSGPEQEAVLADSVGRAVLVVLETLTPAERVAFVLHDVFAVPYAEIAPILERSPDAAKKLGGRARIKVHVGAGEADVDVTRHRRVVDAFLAAIRAGDMDALLAVLAPDVVRRVDPVLLPAGGAAAVVRGARAVVEDARRLSAPGQEAELVLVDGAPGAVVVHDGRLTLALTFIIQDDRITEFEVIGDPARLAGLTVVTPAVGRAGDERVTGTSDERDLNPRSPDRTA